MIPNQVEPRVRFDEVGQKNQICLIRVSNAQGRPVVLLTIGFPPRQVQCQQVIADRMLEKFKDCPRFSTIRPELCVRDVCCTTIRESVCCILSEKSCMFQRKVQDGSLAPPGCLVLQCMCLFYEGWIEVKGVGL